MEPRLIHRETSRVLGIATQIRRGSETSELFAGIWGKFESRRQEIESVALGETYFGVRFPTEDEDVSDYLAGMVVAADTPPLDGLEKRTVPGGPFAVFECPVEAIGETYRYIFTGWFANSDARFDPTGPVFEEYPEDTSKRPVRIYVPLERPITAACCCNVFK